MKNTLTLFTVALGFIHVSDAFAQRPFLPAEKKDIFPLVVMNCDFEKSGFKLKYNFEIQLKTNLEDSTFQATPQPQDENSRATSYTLNKVTMPDDNSLDAVRINASGIGPEGDTLVFEIAIDAKGPTRADGEPGLRGSAVITEYESKDSIIYTSAASSSCSVELK